MKLLHIFIIISLPFLTVFVNAQDGVVNEDYLTNQDVIKLVNSGISETLIIGMINSKKTNFVITPDNIIELSKKGVSDQIIMVMADSKKNTELKSKNELAHEITPVYPKSFGYYVKKRGQYFPLHSAKTSMVKGLSIVASGVGTGVDGVKDQDIPNFISAEEFNEILIYQHNYNPENIVISKMKHLSQLRAEQFNMGTDPEFFYNVYKTMPETIIKIDMYRPIEEVKFRVEPVTSKPGMFRVLIQDSFQDDQRIVIYEKGKLSPYQSIIPITSDTSNWICYPIRFGDESLELYNKEFIKKEITRVMKTLKPFDKSKFKDIESIFPKIKTPVLSETEIELDNKNRKILNIYVEGKGQKGFYISFMFSMRRFMTRNATHDSEAKATLDYMVNQLGSFPAFGIATGRFPNIENTALIAVIYKEKDQFYIRVFTWHSSEDGVKCTVLRTTPEEFRDDMYYYYYCTLSFFKSDWSPETKSRR